MLGYEKAVSRVGAARTSATVPPAMMVRHIGPRAADGGLDRVTVPGMRRSGLVDTVEGLGRHDHLCWAFDSLDDYRALSGRFLAEGLAGGQRVIFLAASAKDSDLDGADGFAAARAVGAAQVQDLGVYGSGRQVDPAAQVLAYAQATERALADGYTGLRVAADATSLVGTVDARAAFARYEHLIDVYTTRHPFSAMCGYHRGTLGGDAVAELACMHSLARRSSTTLQVRASGRPGIAVALSGEIDMHGHAQLRTALSRVDLPAIDGVVTIDATDLSFIDHQGLIGLVEHVRGRGATTVVQVGRASAVPVLASLLWLPDLEVRVS